jgi:hypothetical protein
VSEKKKTRVETQHSHVQSMAVGKNTDFLSADCPTTFLFSFFFGGYASHRITSQNRKRQTTYTELAA